MRFAFSPSARSYRLPNHRSRHLIFHQPVQLMLAALLAATLGGPVTLAANPSFAFKQDFATGQNPRGVTVGDLNGDGKLDLAAANVNSNTVSVLLNTTTSGAATPTLAAKEDFATGTGPVSVAAGDLNGDGKLDLMVANFNSNNVSVLLNTTATGAATPSFAVKQEVATSEGPIYLTTGDINGDGKLDVIVLNLLSNAVSVLLNMTAPGAATSSFAAKQDFVTGVGPLSVTVCDLNGDGKLDLAVANFDFSTVSVLLNTTGPGSATSSFSGVQDFNTGDGPASVTSGDLNGDGKLDLVIANFVFNTVSVLLNTTAPGATTASFTANQEFGTGTGPISVTLGDLNEDGRLDLAVANFNSNAVSVLLNTTTPGAVMPSFAATLDFATGEAPLSVTVADLNADGRLDLAVGNLNVSTVSVLLNTTDSDPATPSFATKQDLDTGSSPRSVSVGDLNGDGKLDLAVVNVNSSTVSVLLNTTPPGAAVPSFATEKEFATGTNPVSVTLSDLNRDGKLDLAVANINSNNISVLLNTTAPGAATPSFATKQEFATSENPVFVAVGDLNGDGKLDLIVTNLISTVSVLFNTAAPGETASFAAKHDFATGDGPRSVSIGDLNLDGKLDLAIANFNTNTVTVLLNTTAPGGATPSFAAIHDFPTGVRPIYVSEGDLNGDGKLDLALVNVASNTVSVLLNTTAPGAGAPSFSAKQDFGTGFNPTSISVGDLNGDGKLDLAVANANSANVSVFLNTTTPGAPTPSFAIKEDFDAGAGSVSVASADLNGDGKLDLVVANVDSDTVSVLLNTATIPSPTPTPTPIPNTSTVQFLGPVEVNEGSDRAVVTVTRTGDTSGAASVDYLTTDNDNFTISCADTVNNLGAAFGRCDFALSLDTLTFAPGETIKTFSVPIIDDSIPEGPETFTVTLSNPRGATLGLPSSVTVTTVDNDQAGAPNPIFKTSFFVRQHYLDFLSREPDQAGFDAWVALLNNCSDPNNDPTCDRIKVSSSFFLSQEFQLKAFYVFRFYKLAFNRLPTYAEMVVDMRAVTGQTPGEVFQKKAAFADGFVQRTEFKNEFGNAQFVGTLMDRNNLRSIHTPDPATPDGTLKVTLTANELSGQLAANAITPAQALRAIADSDEVFALEFNQAFVAMEYYGYLRRTPDTAGFNAWLNQLNANPTDFRTIVNGFVNSSEYRLRFGP